MLKKQRGEAETTLDDILGYCALNTFAGYLGGRVGELGCKKSEGSVL